MGVSFGNSLRLLGLVGFTALLLGGCGGSSGSDGDSGNPGFFRAGGVGGNADFSNGGFNGGGIEGGPRGPVGPGTGVALPFGPGGAGGDVAALNAQGLAALRGGEFVNFVQARDLFAQAVAAIGPGTAQNDRDTAFFFLGTTRVAAVVSELPSDGLPDGLNDVGDFLDALGFAASPRTSYKGLQAPGVFPASVTGADVRQFLTSRVRSELEAGIANLTQVSQSFVVTWTRKEDGPGIPGSTGELSVESDFGDALAFRSSFQHALGAVLVVGSYDLGGDVANVLNNTGRTVQDILSGNPTALLLADAGLLAQARAAFDSGIADGLAASEFMEAETDAQNDDLISIADTPALTVNEFQAEALVWRNALTATTPVRSRNGQSTATLSLQNFFDGSANAQLRPQMPPFTGDLVSGLFPGLPFGPVYGNYVAGSLSDPNRDINLNNIPDTLE